ncbi:MAG: phosphatase PAP2 family protein [Paludibacter sp.]|nr:phosphatase PAP2 family protein [Paludibacter sp.]
MKTKIILIAILSLTVCQSYIYGQTNEISSFNSDCDSIPQAKDCRATEIVGIVLPSAMIIYGLISLDNNGIRQVDYNVHNSLERNNRFWNISADNYVQFVPAIAAYTLKFCKVKNTNNLLDMTVIYGLSNALAGGITYGTKIMTGRMRPDKSNSQSFPSGHTETAFVAAEFLHQEYKDQSALISVGGYVAAAFVGVARVYNNKHWVSDVITGAGVGILSTKAIYWLYPYINPVVNKILGIKDTSQQTFIYPQYDNRQFSIMFSKTF